MFVNACQTARGFTLPVVLSRRAVSGACSAGIGTCILINEDGWAITAFHLIEEIKKCNESASRYSETEAKKKQLREDESIDKKERSRQLKSLGRPSDDQITHSSAWWGGDGHKLVELRGLPFIDLALIRLEGVDCSRVHQFPRFKVSPSPPPGKSLCRIGFPFHQIVPEFDEQRGGFSLPPGSVPLPLFPNEGILTREVIVAADPPLDPAPPFKLSLIETSSPGLRGQSGGPIFDESGLVWAMQVKTMHYHLGFSPPVPGGKAADVEHQFLNVGWGVSAETIVGFASNQSIRCEVA